MKVSNMVSKSGNKVANQFIITDGNTEYFQSYKTIVAKCENGKIIIDSGNPFSKTTSKYLYSFLSTNREMFNANVKSGQYGIADLNC